MSTSQARIRPVSPALSDAELPKRATGNTRGFAGLRRSTAMSESGSVPTSSVGGPGAADPAALPATRTGASTVPRRSSRADRAAMAGPAVGNRGAGRSGRAVAGLQVRHSGTEGFGDFPRISTFWNPAGVEPVRKLRWSPSPGLIAYGRVRVGWTACVALTLVPRCAS